ncbi:M91 family zinc metallopeptidase [Microbulbifer sp. OS29]|uniref:M91 family zinc metallopeptidase n=1 Tax=Microbulbifer okhotskensis TaxID=2926617 RepID=A0A9X2ETI8_9GAMM|nr:M91 family zinc metallopeptidase [Microbulbifer okhotskensis]MCO1335528.1 M91 family zinc metallopeptidase [Microbulbifer okhotskensis]
MGLCIDSNNIVFIAQVRTNLNTLLGGVGTALTYTQEKYRTGGRYVLRVTEGLGILTAAGLRAHSTTLIRRLIASPHDTRITEHHALGFRPDKWMKDQIWSGFKSYIPMVSADQGFMAKVMSAGSSGVVMWNNTIFQTANLTNNGTVVMGNCPSYITLGHELVHADRCNRGRYLSGSTNSTFLADERQAPMGRVLRQQPAPLTMGRIANAGLNIIYNNITVPNPNNNISTRTSGWVWVGGSMELREEIATVGLSDDQGNVPIDPLVINENMIRAEHGVAKRMKYGQIRNLN